MRDPFNQTIKKLGPGDVIPYMMPKKKSFHLNLVRKWV